MTAAVTPGPSRAGRLDDAALIGLSLDEPEWFAVLFDRHGGRIHDYAARRLGVQAAEDITAETFCTAFRRRGSYDRTQPQARPWLYGIASRLIARHRRAEERYLRALQRTGVDPLPEPLDDAVVERVAAQAERRLAGAVAKLNPGDRDVLLLVEDATRDFSRGGVHVKKGTLLMWYAMFDSKIVDKPGQR
ncbi:RNA polymerase sigma factor [Actinomadura gamaensis]|uniref:RNA polymerase sigma factor n=1 Tax=Actinomadura gamaensis TaxID=1763541 RepID=A0ABV9U822_9ACTN